MSNALEQLNAFQFTCPESIDIAAHIRTTLAAKPPSDSEEVMVGYAVCVPFFLQAIWKAASEQEQLDKLQPLISNIKTYFLNAEDLVPDHQGPIGLLDDAYMVYCFIDRVNKRWKESTGAPLAEIDVDFAMQMMAGHLGEETAQLVANQIDIQMSEDDDSNVDLATVGKYVLGGLAAMFVVNQVMNSGQKSNSDQWVELMANRIDHGW